MRTSSSALLSALRFDCPPSPLTFPRTRSKGLGGADGQCALVAPVLLLVMALPAFAAEPRQTSRPPKNLHLVGITGLRIPANPATYPPNARTPRSKRVKRFGHRDAVLRQRLSRRSCGVEHWITDAHWIIPATCYSSRETSLAAGIKRRLERSRRAGGTTARAEPEPEGQAPRAAGSGSIIAEEVRRETPRSHSELKRTSIAMATSDIPRNRCRTHRWREDVEICSAR